MKAIKSQDHEIILYFHGLYDVNTNVVETEPIMYPLYIVSMDIH